MGMEKANRIDDTHLTGVVRNIPVTMEYSHHVIRLVPMTGIKLFTYSADILFLYQSSASAWLYKHLWITYQYQPRTSMTHVACESKLRSVVVSFMHLCPGDWVGIGRVVVYYVRSTHAFSAGIKCLHCILVLIIFYTYNANM